MVIKRVGPVSVAKNVAILYALLGLIFGAIFSLISMAGGFAAAADRSGPGAFIGAMVGVGAIIIFPIFYGCMGFVGGLISSALYNVVAAMVGGIELDVE